MGKLLLAVVLIGGIGFGVYHFVLKPKPAFDVGLIENQLEFLQAKMEGKRAVAESLASGVEMPSWLAAQVNYLNGVSNILENHIDDCDATAAALRSLAGQYKSEAGQVDQRAVFAELSRYDRNQQQQLAAKAAVVMLDGFERLVPLVDDYCDACPKESAVFHEVLF